MRPVRQIVHHPIAPPWDLWVEQTDGIMFQKISCLDLLENEECKSPRMSFRTNDGESFGFVESCQIKEVWVLMKSVEYSAGSVLDVSTGYNGYRALWQ